MNGRYRQRRASQKPASESKKAVLHAVRTRETATVHDVVQVTGVSQPTALKWLSVLESEGLVERCGFGPSTGGRPPALYRFNARAGIALGIHVEIPTVRLALLDLNGTILSSRRERLDTSVPGAVASEDLINMVKSFVAQHESEQKLLVTCGLAFTGFIDQANGVLISTPRLRGWTQVPVVSRFRQELGIPVFLTHEIDAYTLAEVARGVGRSLDQFLFLRIGEGLGIRLFQRGVSAPRPFSNAGLLGHTTVRPDGLLCVCGNHGCLEMYVSERALFRRARELGLLDTLSLLPRQDGGLGGQGQASALFKAILTNPAASFLADELTDYLAIGVANAINVFQVSTVVISGFVVEGGEPLRQQIIDKSKARLWPVLANQTEIRFATVHYDVAGPTGAGLFALQQQQPLDFTLKATPRRRRA